MTPPFDRTVCACDDCKACCRRQPGHLIPGDMERIADFLGEDLATAKAHFWASPGALVMDRQTNRVRRIRTITPRFDKRQGRCVFLDDDGRCKVHAVAPFGCAYADTHMSAAEWQPRGVWALRHIDTPDYQALRQTLDLATHYEPVVG